MLSRDAGRVGKYVDTAKNLIFNSGTGLRQLPLNAALPDAGKMSEHRIVPKSLVLALREIMNLDGNRSK